MLKIFVVDDEMLVLEGICILINTVNVECEIVGTANNGREAWEKLCEKTLEVDLLITDIRMPGLSGLELIEKCKDLYPEMMTAVISGYREFIYAQRAIGLGVIGYLDKPVSEQKLETVVSRAQENLYRENMAKQDKIYLLNQCDEMVRFLNEGDCERTLESYTAIKELMHKEDLL